MAMQFQRSSSTAAGLLLVDGIVVDGSGRGPQKSDVRIVADRIVEMGPDLPVGDCDVIHLGGDVVSPGFIDLHAHSEGSLWNDPQHLPKVAQGVTFELLGQDGLGFAPVTTLSHLEDLADRLVAWHGRWDRDDLRWDGPATFFTALERRGLGVNVASLVPHGTVRLATGVSTSTPPTSAEIQAMTELVWKGMAQGAFGLSTGLVYEPARHADTNELVALCEPLGRNGVFVPHLRDYQRHPFEAYGEALEIASRAGTRLHLTHALLNGKENAGKASDLVDLISRTGTPTTADVYPYDAGSTYLHVFLPGDVASLPTNTLLDELLQPEVKQRVGAETSHIDWSKVVVAGVDNQSLRSTLGLSIQDLAEKRGEDPIEAYCYMLIEDELSTTCVHFNGNWDNVSTLIKADNVAVASDSILVGERPHPRGWGAFARFIEMFVAAGDLAIGPAIHKLTGLPASILGMTERGILRPGATADICSFDPAAVRERATYEQPQQLAEGFSNVLVNGTPVIRDSTPTGALPGRVVRR